MKKIEKDYLKNEVLNKYYDIHDNVAVVKLTYKNFDELIDYNFGDDNVEKLSDKLFDDLVHAINLLPRKYNIEIKIIFEEYGNYTKEMIENIIDDNLKMKGYAIGLEQVRNQKTGALLGITGVILLLASYFCSKISLPTILFDIVNITGTLFIWEGMTVVLIDNNKTINEVRRLLKKIKKFEVVCNQSSDK